MKNLVASALFTLPLTALADVAVYGKINTSLQAVDAPDKPNHELVSNASRLGFKGETEIGESTTAFFVLEYEEGIDDRANGIDSGRNGYVGVKGNWGSARAGAYDTPFKVSQKKVDLFNDYQGDIKQALTVNDNRSPNQVNYTSPKFFGGMVASVSYVASEELDANNGLSSSLSYSRGNFYIAGAYDINVKGQEHQALRGTVQYKIAGFQLGGLVENYDNDDDSEAGYFASVKYNLTDKFNLRGQYGQSDIKGLKANDDGEFIMGGETYSIGAFYTVTKEFELHSYYTHNADDASDRDFLGLGVQLKF